MYFAAIDEGTTSTRTIIFDAQGQPVSEHQIALETYFPHSGWVELRAEEVWGATRTTWFEALNKASLNPEDITAIGITNQRETTVVWDRITSRAIHNAIVWQDRRTTDYCDVLRGQELEPRVQAKTGLLLDPYFSASKLAWILQNVNGARQQAEAGQLAFGTIDSFLLWRMTGGRVHATDITNAARTSLYNIYAQEWDSELLEMFHIPHEVLPEVKDNIAEFGLTDKSIWGAEIPVKVMIGDQQSALVGQGCVMPEAAKCTYGTGGFLMINTGHQIVKSTHRLLQTVAYRVKDEFALAVEGSIFSVGTTVNWLRDVMHLIRHAEDSEALAASVTDNGGVYLVPAFTGMGAPNWRPDVRAAILGLTRASKPEHIVRAGLEAIAYQTQDLVVALKEEGLPAIHALRVDGGVVQNRWLLQFLSSLLGVPIMRAKRSEATAYGVCQLLRFDAGELSGLQDIADEWLPDQVFEPRPERDKMHDYYQGWLAAVRSICH